MFQLETERLMLVHTPIDVLQRRLVYDTFTMDVVFITGTRQVTFLPDWPGDALVLFPMMIEQYQDTPDQVPWGGVIIEREEWVAVGQMGFKGVPDQDGNVEIGYGINPSYQRRGYATEMVRALVEWALMQPSVWSVTAECREDNHGSIRVLEKVGFQHIGQRLDEEDGSLLLWKKVT